MARYERIPGGEKNELTGKPFTKQELEKVCDLYIELDGKGIHENNPKIHELAYKLDRTVRSVENQLLGFRAFVTKKTGRINYNSLIPKIWEEKNTFKTEEIIKIDPPKERELFDEFKFRISSQLKNILGKNLITDDFVAVFELVKNSFDAHAKKVKIIFEKDKITIWDDGKGMNRRDIIDKWLFIAYSAKNEGVEDIEFEGEKNTSYRDRINPNRSYAGQKGIGRMGSDRLGSNLEMTTKKINDSVYWNLKFDWDKYEVDALDEFDDIEIKHKNSQTTKFEGFENGLILEISNLRNIWPRKKIIDLKRSLAKLINPFTIQNEFNIEIICIRELEKDNELKEKDDFNALDIVNGDIKNFVFEALNIATTQIKVSITENEEYIETELIDRGNLIYKIQEPNKYKYIPNESNILLFYLNTPAKSNFTKIMGVSPKEFGSIFVFNNGFRVLPFGEPNNDPFNINVRKGQGRTRFLGTRELIGQVVISKNTEQFQESSSRDGGFLQSSGTNELQDFFLESLKKLELYVVPILWTISKRSGDNDEVLDLTAKNQVLDFVEKISGKKNIQLVDYSDKLVNYITENVEEQNLPLFNKLREIALRAGDNKGLMSIDKEEANYQKEIKRRKEAELKAIEEENKRIEAEEKAAEEEKKRIEAEEAKKEIETENSFLKSITTQDLEVVLSFMHSIGISANMMDNYLSSIYQKLRRGIEINERQFKKAMEAVALESRKIISITRYATKANFKVFAEEGTFEIVNFISEYLINILKPLRGEEINIEILNPDKLSRLENFKPIELNLIIDNLISNSIRAGAKNFKTIFKKEDSSLNIIFFDDGPGISDKDIARVMEFGFTTTSGSGLGLFHVKKVLDDLKWEFIINNKLEKGIEFIIKINF